MPSKFNCTNRRSLRACLVKRFFPLPGVVRVGDRVGLRVSNSIHVPDVATKGWHKRGYLHCATEIHQTRINTNEAL